MLDVLQPSFDKYQFGAIKGRSTAHALISLLQEQMETLDAGGSVRTVFVDYRKAFDRLAPVSYTHLTLPTKRIV